MNYSLTGKARIAAKAVMMSKHARAANISNYANREATKTVTPRLKWSFDGATISWVGKTLVDRSKSLKVN